MTNSPHRKRRALRVHSLCRRRWTSRRTSCGCSAQSAPPVGTCSSKAIQFLLHLLNTPNKKPRSRSAVAINQNEESQPRGIKVLGLNQRLLGGVFMDTLGSVNEAWVGGRMDAPHANGNRRPLARA